MVSVHYKGQLLDGTVFDSSYKRKQPIDFAIGVGQVIAGWDEGIQLLQVGDKARLVIPSHLAYGEAGAGDLIPPNSPLKFTVEVLAALPAGSSTAVFADYSDFDINTKKIGLSDELIATTTSLKIGLDSADELVGTSSNDLLIGLKGNDRMMGTRGADVLIGGKGKNTFVYEKVKDSLAATGKSDHILDFGRKDKIDLSSVAKEMRFIGSDPFSGTAGDVRFKKGTLELDKDGDGVADLALQLPGTNTKFLKASNLIL